MPKKTIIITTIIAVLTIITTTLAFYPFFNPRQAFFDRNEGNEEFILTKFDFFNPTYTVIINHRDNNDRGERAVSVAKLKRDGLFSFELGDILAGGKSQNATFDEVKRYIQNNNLVEKNPNPDIFVGNFGIDESKRNEISRLSGEEGYYLNYSIKQSFDKKSTEDFKQLKKGMTWGEVDRSGVDYDNAASPGFVSGKYERRARVNDEGVLFIVMAFSGNVNSKPDSVLEDVYIVYLDRSTKKLDLQSK